MKKFMWLTLILALLIMPEKVAAADSCLDDNLQPETMDICDERDSFCGTSLELQTELFSVLLQRKAGISPYAGGINSVNLMPSTGDVKLLVIPIMFADSTPITGNWEDDYKYYQEVYFGDDNGEATSNQSVKAYYSRQSYGRLNITGDVLPIFFAPKPKVGYSSLSPSIYYLPLVKSALETYCIDFSKYDANNDGCIDCLCIIEGNGINSSGNNGAFNAQTGWATTGKGYVLSNGNSYTYQVGQITNVYCESAGVSVHELGHCMGLSDNYLSPANCCYLPPIHEDLMGGGNGVYINAFYKYLLGWIDPLVLTDKNPIQDIELWAVENRNVNFEQAPKAILYTPDTEELPFTEFFIAEYRNGSDSNRNAKPGVTLWHGNAEVAEDGFFVHRLNYLQSVRPTGGETNAKFTFSDLFVPQGTPWDRYAIHSLVSPDTLPANTNFSDGTETRFSMEVVDQTDEYVMLRAGATPLEETEQEPLVILPVGEKVYGDKPFQLFAEGGSGTGAVTYEVLSGDALEVTPDGYATILKAGLTRIKATKKGDDNYSGSVSAKINLSVEPRDIACASIDIPDAPYTGQAVQPAPVLTDLGVALTADDYEISYDNNISVGNGRISLKGKGNYTGAVEACFSIVKMSATISTVDELRQLAEEVNSGNEYYCYGDFQLSADIDLGKDAEPWIPIGTSRNHFNGTFDGNGHTISLYVEGNDNWQGLFAYIGTIGVVQDTGVNGKILGNNFIGGIASWNYGTIRRCYNACDVVGFRQYVGGIAGRNLGIIENCYNSGTIRGYTKYIGGISGDNSRPCSVKNCYSFGTIIGQDSQIGGVIGWNNSGTVSNCYYLDSTADGGVDSIDKSGVAEKLTKEEFCLTSSFAGWNFSDVWKMSDACGRPELQSTPELKLLHAHSYNIGWDKDDTTHWRICEICGKADMTSRAAHASVIDLALPATCTEDGLTEGSHCEVCGYIITPQTAVSATGHSYTTDWTSDEAGHWHKCRKCDGITDVVEHTLVIDPAVAATCTKDGMTEGSHCAVCRYVIKAQTTVSAEGHRYSSDWTVDGTSHWHQCTSCDEVSDIELHTEDAGTETKAPTEDEMGIMTYACTVCGRIVRTESIPATGKEVLGGLAWHIDAEDELSLTGNFPEDDTIWAACWDDNGRFLGVKVLTADCMSAQLEPGWARLKLFWLNEALAPQGAAVDVI